VMLLTPHIVRSMDITEADLKPLFIGSQGALGIGGPPPLIAPDAAPATPNGVPPATAPGGAAVPVPGGVVVPPPGSTPVPGTVFVPSQPAPTNTPAATTPTPAQPPTSPPGAASAAPSPTAADPNTVPVTTMGLGIAQVTVTPPAGAIRVGGGPYTVPISIANAARLSTITLTLTFDPSMLRVRAVNEGGFMRSGGANATFTQQVGTGRVDFTITRSSDAIGASGQGLLGSVLFDAIGPGNVTLSASGAGTGPGGTPMGLQFRPVTVTVQP
jgi:hypothetical protein